MAHPNIKKIKDWDFDDLANYVALDMHDALLEGGAKGMKTRFYLTYNIIVQWQAAKKVKP